MDSPDITKCKSIIKDTEKSNSSTDHIDSDIDKKETELVGLSGLHTDISNIADSLAANSQEDNIIAGTSRTSRSNQNFFPEFLLGHNIESCSNNSEEISDLISDSTSSCSVENRDSIAHSGQSFGESSNNQKGIKRSIESSENSTEQSFLPKKFKFDSGESSRTDCSIEQRTPCDPRRPTPFETLANIISQDNTADSDSLEDVEMADAPPSGQSRQTDNSNTSNAASNETAGGPSNPAAAAATASSPAALLSALHQFEMNPNDRDLNHLQAMLEAHGLPLQMFGGMTSRMHQQSINTATSAQAQAVVQRLEQTMDEGEQLGNVMELCQLLVMGNEETLAGFPTKQAVPILITLLQCEHNFEIMLHACRALHYIVEALPRSSANLVDAIPVLLEKLQIIEYMDVAEQALQVLEILSRKHSKSILKMNGIASCLMFIDFFSISAQRSALAITANCCYSLNMEEFHFVRDSLSLLTGRLNHQDKKSVECVCLCLSRLVENFRSDERVLKEIAAQGLLSGIQQLLILTPPPVGTTTFVIVLHMLVVMCTNCPDLAVILLKLNISETLCYLLIGAKEADTATQGIELLPRSTQELFEIVGLIQELMPALPSDGIFSINSTVMNGDSTYVSDLAEWQWADDKSGWHSYSVTDNHIIEGAHRTGEPDVSLATLGRAYIIDFSMMQQINEDTGTSRAVQRVLKLQQAANSASLHLKSDSRADILVENASLVTTLLNSLFAILYEIYCSSASLPVKHKCLQAILRMVYYGNAELLENVLRSVPVSSHIAAMLASTDSKTVVIALQMAHILMDKLPDVFSVYFRRQGVLHQITHLSQSEAVDLSIKKKDNKTKTPTSSLSKTSLTNTSASTPAATSSSATSAATPTAPPCEKRASTSTSPPDTRSHQMKLSDVLKGKKPQKSPSAKESKEDMTSDSSSASPSASATNLPAGQAKPGTTSVKSRLFGSMITSSEFFSSYAKDSNKTSGTITPKAFLASLNPSRWGRSASSSGPLVAKSSKEGQLGKSPDQSCPRSANSREVIRQWISENAGKFIERYFGTNTQGFNHPSLNILNQLLTATSCIGNIESDEIHLRDIAEILCNNDVSPFEVIHSNFVSRFLSYLTDSTNTELRDTRLRMFLHVFLGCPKAAIINPADDWQLLTPPPMACLVSKLMACFNHLEQFQLRSQEHLGSLRGDIGRDANPVRFFNTHLMKCSLQSHPSCNSSNQWKGGLVRIDPLAPVQSIENFLIQRGQSNQEAVAVSSKHAKESKHTFELYIGEHHLPYNMTVYQAVKQYAQPLEGSEPDSAHMHGESSIWMRDHLIWYKLIPGQESTSTEPAGATATTANPKKTKAEKAQHSPSRHRREDRKSGGADLSISLKDTVQLCLQSSLPASVTVKDPSLEVLTLLRLLHSLGRHWNSLYKLSELSHSVQRGLQVTHSHLEFMSNKMAAKASRQLQDPFIVLTGTLPQWLVQLPYVCPFLLPYETRLLLFYVISFDRDRAMQRLQDTNETSSMAENVGRLAHRLERKKKIIQRQSLLEQSETVINDLTGSRAVLEIQYEEEVGSGLGPTLEFYALVSQELQRADLQLWSGEPVLMNHIRDESSMVLYTYSPCGLFPAPIGKNIEASRLDNVLSKFRFLGKFMAKSLMDSRLLDLSLSPVFYKWLLGQESTLCSSDLGRVNPTLAKTISKLEHLVVQKKQIEQDLSALPEKKLAALQSLTLDGCPIEDLCLDFVLPGSADIELKPDGKDIPVTLDNLEEYIWLVTHWILYEGVRKQFAALREGFESFFPISSLNLFYADELDQLFCGKQEEMWDVKYLMEVCHPDHGYSHDSQAVQFFYHILSSYTSEEQRMFAQFVTGSPRLPVGGLKSLNPPLTIVRKTLETKQNSDDFLPSVMTCVNYLKLPDYSSVDIMRDKLALAACEGQLSFHLS